MFPNDVFPIAVAFNICKKDFNSNHKRNSQISPNKFGRFRVSQ